VGTTTYTYEPGTGRLESMETLNAASLEMYSVAYEFHDNDLRKKATVEWRDPATNTLTLSDRDPQSKEPHFKQCAVRLATPDAEMPPIPADD